MQGCSGSLLERQPWSFPKSPVIAACRLPWQVLSRSTQRGAGPPPHRHRAAHHSHDRPRAGGWPGAGALQPHRSLGVATATAEADGAAVLEPQWNDVVEYQLPVPVAGATRGVARVDEVRNGRVTLAPLQEEEEGVWVESDVAAPAVLPVGVVLCILDVDYSQRQDREHNPHGEHAHDVYTMLGRPLEGVFGALRGIVVRDGVAGGGGSGGAGDA